MFLWIIGQVKVYVACDMLFKELRKDKKEQKKQQTTNKG